MQEPESLTCNDMQSLDVLWEQAEHYGAVKVEQSFSREYDASISISTTLGSSIYARGKSNKLAKEALLRAINEAEKLVAGYLASGGAIRD